MPEPSGSLSVPSPLSACTAAGTRAGVGLARYSYMNFCTAGSEVNSLARGGTGAAAAVAISIRLEARTAIPRSILPSPASGRERGLHRWLSGNEVVFVCGRVTELSCQFGRPRARTFGHLQGRKWVTCRAD